MCVILLYGCVSRENRYFNRAIRYEAAGEFEKAIRYLDKILGINPLSIVAYWHRGHNRFDLSDYAGAMSDYRQMIAIDSTCVVGYLNVAAVYLRTGYYHSAIAYYNKALLKSGARLGEDYEILSSFIFAHFTTNSLLAALSGRRYRPERIEQPVLSIAEIAFYRGIAFYFADNLELALRDFRFSQANTTNFEWQLEISYWIGQVFLRTGQIDYACRYLRFPAMAGYSYAERDYEEFCRCR